MHANSLSFTYTATVAHLLYLTLTAGIGQRLRFVASRNLVTDEYNPSQFAITVSVTSSFGGVRANSVKEVPETVTGSFPVEDTTFRVTSRLWRKAMKMSSAKCKVNDSHLYVFTRYVCFCCGRLGEGKGAAAVYSSSSHLLPVFRFQIPLDCRILQSRETP